MKFLAEAMEVIRDLSATIKSDIASDSELLAGIEAASFSGEFSFNHKLANNWWCELQSVTLL